MVQGLRCKGNLRKRNESRNFRLIILIFGVKDYGLIHLVMYI